MSRGAREKVVEAKKLRSEGKRSRFGLNGKAATCCRMGPQQTQLRLNERDNQKFQEEGRGTPYSKKEGAFGFV